MPLFERLRDEDFAYLTTIGRKTGRRHRIEVWFALRRQRIYLLSGGGRSADWVQNIFWNGRVRIQVGSRAVAARGRIVKRAGEDRLARELLDAKYQWPLISQLSGGLSATKSECERAWHEECVTARHPLREGGTERMDLNTIVIWIVFGAIVGIVARFLVPGPDPMGMVGTIVLGIVGSFVGGYLFQLLFQGNASLPAPTAGWIGSIIGAIVVLLIYRYSQGRRVSV